jgi:hypothetical protein
VTIWSALAVIAFTALALWVDAAFFDSAGIAYLGKALFDGTEWLAFWR